MTPTWARLRNKHSRLLLESSLTESTKAFNEHAETQKLRYEEPDLCKEICS